MTEMALPNVANALFSSPEPASPAFMDLLMQAGSNADWMLPELDIPVRLTAAGNRACDSLRPANFESPRGQFPPVLVSKHGSSVLKRHDPRLPLPSDISTPLILWRCTKLPAGLSCNAPL